MPTLPTIKKGSKGAAVKYCQERLNAKGFHVSTDGDFGPKTDLVVRQYQASENIRPDGVVGPNTWKHLLVETSAQPPKDLLEEQRNYLLALIPADAPDVVRKTLKNAIAYLGEKEIPNGSNRGPGIDDMVATYNDYWKIGDLKGRPWCVMSVASWIALGCGYTIPAQNWAAWPNHPWWNPKTGGGAYRGASSDVEKWAKAKGWWTTARASAYCPSGAYFTMGRGSSGSDASSSASAGHTALIVCDNGDGTVTTIEGNVSNKVASYRRKKTALRGWAKWW